ncbi:prepilin-type N-terminal cleavage/methylation domain-containing protein [Candidatus Sumerlaeota bacterium]|nr:prepilin-type N-terminal cleavage/methylation domain-containing protein [Candidatus Sumerlaeota bacterium]
MMNLPERQRTVLIKPRTSREAAVASRRGRAGFSIIELLVAIIIIGILVAVLIPVIASRTAAARVARAQSDITNLGEAEERVGVDTGFYVRLFALNDVLNGDGESFNRGRSFDPIDRADGLTDYKIAQTYIVFPDTNSLFIDPNTGLYATTTRQNVIDRLSRNETNYDGTVAWFGPYINWQKDSNIDNVETTTSPNPDGVPDDPWGNNYVIMTRRGIVLEPQGDLIETNVQPNVDGGFSSGGSYPAQVFDRSVILTLGPNGLPGAGNAVLNTNQRPGDVLGDDFGDGDDLYHVFGR